MDKPDYQEGGVALAEFGRDHAGLALHNLPHPEGRGEVVIGSTPLGEVVDLKPAIDAWRTRPERSTGTALAHDLASFIAHVVAYKDARTRLFADILSPQPSLQAVLNYHGTGDDTAHGDHRTRYDFPLSDEWKTWTKNNGEAMSQSGFGAWLEDHLVDVASPPEFLSSAKRSAAGGDFGKRTPDEDLAYLAQALDVTFAEPRKLLDLSRGLSLTSEEKIVGSAVASSGEVTITYSQEHKDANGAQLKVPQIFLLAIPLFRNGNPHYIAARLRYRVREGRVLWFYELYRHLQALDHAVREACIEAQKQIGLPLYYGTPEGGRG